MKLAKTKTSGNAKRLAHMLEHSEHRQSVTQHAVHKAHGNTTTLRGKWVITNKWHAQKDTRQAHRCNLASFAHPYNKSKSDTSDQ